MKVRIDRDEWYPVYWIYADLYDGCETIEIDAATLERWYAVQVAFDGMQDEMRAAYKKLDESA
jgi:hypothetical protein